MIRRFVGRRIRAAHQDWSTARDAWHATQGTPSARDADIYLVRTRRQLDRWESIYRLIGGYR